MQDFHVSILEPDLKIDIIEFANLFIFLWLRDLTI